MHSCVVKLDKNLEKFEDEINKFEKKTNDRKCSINANTAESLLTSLYNAKENYEDANEKLGKAINNSEKKMDAAAARDDNSSAEVYSALANIFTTTVNGNSKFIYGSNGVISTKLIPAK